MCVISLARNVVLPVSGLAKINPKSPLRREPSDLLSQSSLQRRPGAAIVDSYNSDNFIVTGCAMSSVMSSASNSLTFSNRSESSAVPSSTSRATLASSPATHRFLCSLRYPTVLLTLTSNASIRSRLSDS